MKLKEAKKIHEKFKHLEIVMYDDRLHDPISIDTRNYAEAKGYLSCLRGEEVKALVDAIENLRDGKYSAWRRALLRYYEAIKDLPEEGENK